MARYTDEQFELAIKQSISWRQLSLNLGLHSQSAGNYRTLKAKAQKLGLDTSHFLGKSWNKGKTHNYNTMPLEEWLRLPWMISSKIRLRLLKEKLIKEECAICGLGPIWNERPIVLQLDHIDGDNTHNEQSNFRLLCPNCHSQTTTFVGKHKRP